MYNLFLYKNARPHAHDTEGAKYYYNTVPMSEHGIKQHFKIVDDPSVADFFYMGQFSNDKWYDYSPLSFQYFSGNENRHICDIEGEGGQAIPEWLHNSIITTMGPLKRYENIFKLFTRPTFSRMLLDVVKKPQETFDLPEEVRFGFKGFLNHATRYHMAISTKDLDLPMSVSYNNNWSGPSEPGSEIQEEYIKLMKENFVSLCPRGSGIDSVRLIESCYFNRVPVMISDEDYFLVGEDHYDTSFCYRYIESNPIIKENISRFLTDIHNTNIEELTEKANKAKKYFNDVILKYFADPTKYFLDWLDNEH
jgi:hypothetical protein